MVKYLLSLFLWLYVNILGKFSTKDQMIIGLFLLVDIFIPVTPRNFVFDQLDKHQEVD